MKKTLLIAKIGTFVNLLLAISKIIVGIAANSIAIIADGVHSLGDVISSFVAYVGIKKASKPADKDHPYGHEKYEAVAGFLVAVIMGGSGITIITEVAEKLWSGVEPAQFAMWGIGLMIVSIIANEATARIKFYFGKKHSSLALVADANHDRMDVLSSVVVLIGIFLIQFYPMVDIVLALVIGLYICYKSYRLALGAVEELVDTANGDLEGRIKIFLADLDYSVNEIKTRKMGATYLAEISIKTDEDLDVKQMAHMTAMVDKQIIENFEEVKSTYIRCLSDVHGDVAIMPVCQWGHCLKFRKGLKNCEKASQI